MYILFIALIVITCILLIAVVMIQNSKGGGLASDFSASSQVIGVQRTGDFLEKATWTLAITLITLTLATNFFIERAGTDAPTESAIQQQIDETADPTGGAATGGAEEGAEEEAE